MVEGLRLPTSSAVAIVSIVGRGWECLRATLFTTQLSASSVTASATVSAALEFHTSTEVASVAGRRGKVP